MVNFGAMESVPERHRGRTLQVHNPTVTLMRTTPEENARIGRWIGERLNRMDGPVRFYLPEGGVSALDCRAGHFQIRTPTPSFSARLKQRFGKPARGASSGCRSTSTIRASRRKSPPSSAGCSATGSVDGERGAACRASRVPTSLPVSTP